MFLVLPSTIDRLGDGKDQVIYVFIKSYRQGLKLIWIDG